MKISKRSWHYRWWAYSCQRAGGITPPPDNLCAYVLELVACVLFWGFWIAFGICLLASLPIWLPLLLVWFVLCWVVHLWDNYKERGEVNKVKHPSIVAEWFKAKKAGVCPKVEYTE